MEMWLESQLNVHTGINFLTRIVKHGTKSFFFFFSKLQLGRSHEKAENFLAAGKLVQVLVLSIVGTISCRVKEQYKYFSLHISSLLVRSSHSKA